MAKRKRVARQETLALPISLKIRATFPNLDGADCKQRCLCDDGFEYYIKDILSHPLTPHAEWFCTRLAQLVGIPGPESQIIEMPDNSRAFGSRCEGAAIVNGPPGTLATWVGLVVAKQIPLERIGTTLTRIYAFDHFIHNHDRHPKNFLATAQPSGIALLAFDYSRAWMFNGLPLPNLPFDINNPAERTVKTQRVLTSLFGSYINATEAKEFLNGLKQISSANIRNITDLHPKEWLPEETKKRIISWWSSPDRMKRIDDIAEGIGNGNYL